MSGIRFWVVIGLLLGTAGLLWARGDVDRVPPSAPLANLPKAIGPWQGQDVLLDQAVLDVLGKGTFLNRMYMPTGTLGPVGLFIGYFPTQRTGQAIHSPQNCLPGAGWIFESSGITELIDRNGKHYQVGEYIISDGRTRQEVLYWYRSHGRSIASDYQAKMYTLLDSIRYNRTDAALVRVVTPVLAGEERQTAHLRAVSFAEDMAPMLPAYIPD